MSSRPIVALVGRPNVGKSSLFNRLVGKPLAIVDDEPGVTRDRHEGEAWTAGRNYIVVDTGGLDPSDEDPMRQRIAEQVAVAVDEADVVVCVLDAAAGVAPGDREAVMMLRRTKKPVVYAANKADTQQGQSEAFEMYRLGIDRVIPISALHGRGIGELEAAIAQVMPKAEPDENDEGPTSLDDGDGEGDESGGGVHERIGFIPRIVVVGRPNAGKSSLLNRLAGKERVLVDNRPGTTRDAIDVLVQKHGRSLLFVDTAGIRKKGKVTKEADYLEAASVMQAIRAMERCSVALLLCDADAGVAEQDAKILGLADDRGRAAVIGLNKIDLVPRERRKKLEEDAREKLSFAPWVPIVPLSAQTGRGTDVLLAKVGEVFDAFRKRVPTGALNRFFEKVIATHPPPTMGARAPRLYYITQAEVGPPRFVIMTNEPDHIHFSYRRYVSNQLRKAFGFEGVPLRINYKKRRRRGDPSEDAGERS